MGGRGATRANHIPCMADGPREPDDCGTVCMRPEGHKRGGHRFVRDDEVSVRLTPAGRAALYRALQADLQVGVAHGG